VPSHVLISPIGFQRWKSQEVLGSIEFDHLHVLHTSHPTAKKHAKALIAEVTRNGFTAEETEVRPAFDYVAWSDALEAAVAKHAGAERTINLTAGHGIAIAMAAVVAARTGIPCVCFDRFSRRSYPANPAILASRERLADSDRRILAELRKGERTVTELHAELGIKLSTVSMALQRLRASGWVDAERRGKSISYRLTAGVELVLEKKGGVGP
jgi:DNA-binding transcriptional ArsR family regulator